MSAPLAVDSAVAAAGSAHYEREGYCIAPPVLPADLIARVVPRMDAVMRGEYETGRKPLDYWTKMSDTPGRLRKIDQAHVADRMLYEAVTHPALGEWVAALTGAARLQVWAVQMLHKPPGGDMNGAVGWHQDLYYWNTWWQPGSNIFTAWLAISDVREECGPMHFVPGSHRWGLLEGSDFFGSTEESKRKLAQRAQGAWREVSGAMPAGAFSLHHCLTIHGSQPNVSTSARRSFAIHLCTEQAAPRADRGIDTSGGGYDYLEHLDDPSICPVIYERSEK